MDLHEIGWLLADLVVGENTSVFLRTSPEVLDHTSQQEGKLLVSTNRGSMEVPIGGDEVSVRNLKGVLDFVFFNKEDSRVRILFVWNFKSLMTFFKSRIQKLVAPTVSIIDLQVIEGYMGINKKIPKTLVEAVNRARLLAKSTSWKMVYQAVHQPLMLNVLPAVETTPLLDTKDRKRVYPYYLIEGEANGRLSCYKKFGYLPHNMGPEDREVLRPRGEGYRFICADFRACEVLVLLWLSKDQVLNKLAESGNDLYSEIYKVVTRNDCDSPTKRKISKGMFLPVMYGMGPETLAKRLNLSFDAGKELVGRVRTIFHEAYEWILTAQEQAKSKGTIQDRFGRRRTFAENEAYLARNFVVQSVASTFCLEKLIQLHNSLDGDVAKVAFSIRDGYGMVFNEKVARDVYKLVKQTLETESKLCDGLKMQTEVKLGVKLSNLKVIWKD